MSRAYPIAPTTVNTVRLNDAQHGIQSRFGGGDYNRTLVVRNRTSCWLMIVEPDGSRVTLPPVPINGLEEQVVFDVVIGIKDSITVGYQHREMVDEWLTDPNIVGHGRECFSVNGGVNGSRIFTTPVAKSNYEIQTQLNNKFDVASRFTLKDADLPIDVAFYHIATGQLIIKTAHEPTVDKWRHYPHPIRATTNPTNRLPMIGEVAGINLEFVWIPPRDKLELCLYTKIAGEVIKIPGEHNVVGQPGLTVKHGDGRTSKIILYEDIIKDPEKHGFHLSYDNALAWDTQTTRDVNKLLKEEIREERKDERTEAEREFKRSLAQQEKHDKETAALKAELAKEKEKRENYFSNLFKRYESTAKSILSILGSIGGIVAMVVSLSGIFKS